MPDNRPVEHQTWLAGYQKMPRITSIGTPKGTFLIFLLLENVCCCLLYWTKSVTRKVKTSTCLQFFFSKKILKPEIRYLVFRILPAKTEFCASRLIIISHIKKNNCRVMWKRMAGNKVTVLYLYYVPVSHSSKLGWCTLHTLHKPFGAHLLPNIFIHK